MRIYSLIAALLLAFTIGAQQVERPVLSAYTLGFGTSHIAETYLSPLHYSGLKGSLNYERMQAMKFSPEKWVMRLDGSLSLASAKNQPARNSAMLHLDFNVGWSMLRRINLPKRWSIFAGGRTDIDAGVFYNARNSNNPAAAKAAWTIGLAAGASWQFNIKKVPVCLRYLVDMPVTGVFFSPQYGELYYEIYLGNHKGLVRGAWPGNFFRLNNLLSADFRFGRTILRVGYNFRVASAKASDIVTRQIDHMAVLGVASEWLSLAPDKGPSKDCKIISALY